jgi:hypothetical protein
VGAHVRLQLGQLDFDAIRPRPDSMALLVEAVAALLPAQQVVVVVVPWVLGPPRRRFEPADRPPA